MIYTTKSTKATGFAEVIPIASMRPTRALIAAVVLSAIPLQAVSGAAQTAKDVKGATPLVAIPNELPPKLIVDPPIPEQLALGRVFIQYRTKTCALFPSSAKPL
jgi:Family of unknown function (DUF6130)